MARSYEAETADAARDAIAFVSAIHRDDVSAVRVIFEHSDPFDLPHMIARYFIDFVKAMAVTSPRAGSPDEQVTDFLAHLQAEQRRTAAR